jgi:magnesium-transporting ATPase (P-type)
MLNQKNSGQENIILISNSPIQNDPINTQNSNCSNNYNSLNNEPSQPQSKETSIKKDIVSNSSSMKGGESTSASNTLGQKFNKQKRKSSNKSENNLKQILNNCNNANDNEDNDNNNKEDNIGNNNNYNFGLEPIMEIPPLTKIEKKTNIYEFYINNREKNTEELLYPNNKISTTKYNIFTFLPKALLYQFARLANVYFVAMAIIQCIPIISPLGSATAIAPIVFVFTISLIREGVEDYQRGKLDKEQNADLITAYRDNKWVTVKSGELLLGEIIQVKKDGIFPSDLLLIDSNLNDGICYIETGSLDGEKTLKIKYSPSFTKSKFSQKDEKINYKIEDELNNRNSEIFLLNKDNGNDVALNPKMTTNNKNNQNLVNSNLSLKFHQSQKSEFEVLENFNNKQSNFELNKINESNSPRTMDDNFFYSEIIDYFNIEGIIQCDMPNPSLYMLNGKANMNLNGKKSEFPLDGKNLLLKGAKLRNTQWIVGIIIYTGHNCKIMKNARDPTLKMSSVEKLLNKLLIFIFICQIFFALISAILHSVYYNKRKIIILQSSSFSEENANHNYIDYLPYHLTVDTILNFFTYLLLLNTMIPISLIVTLEMVKIIQGIFITLDAKSYSFHRRKFIKTNTVSLHEELGLVDYIFTDKTGTLTCNQMNLKFCVIGEQCYEFIRHGLKSDEILINKKLREKEEIIPFQNYDMIKGSSIPGDKGESNLPYIIYNNYRVKANNKKSISLDLDSSEKIIEEYWKALALCHDCNIQNGEYIGMSPDNIELVKSARLQGFKFDESISASKYTLSYNIYDSTITSIKENALNNKEKKTNQNNNNNCFILRRNNSINSINNNNETLLTKTIHKQVFEKLCHIEFSSDRKRESVLVKEGNLYKLYIKGADSVIEELLDDSTPPSVLERCRYFVNLFSSQGYRTLFIAMRLLTEEEYEDFIFDLNKALSEIKNKKKKLEEAYAFIEKNLTLIGATIVEDKLQENVPEVIKELREADIKIWMLTGDKLSTAYNIGLSCNLINKNIKTFFIEGVEKKVDDKLNVINQSEQEQIILNFIKEYQCFIGKVENGFLLQKNKQLQENEINSDFLKFGILVDEKALLTITNNKEIEKLFLDVAKDAVSVICCRVSPLQKSLVVKLMKNYNNKKITLAIGDGGNDVSMIMEAHIGIGIYGEEGLRAAQSSDYAIGEFQVLRRLLFVHGYLSLMRNSMMIIYFFYKNFVFTIIHFFYGFINNFSGQTIIDDWYITLYNLLFTSIPLAGRCILDVSLKPDDGKIVDVLIPFLYKEQRDNPIFSIKNFLFDILKGALHSLANYYFTISSIDLILNDDGYESNIWTVSVCLYSNILLIVTLDLIIEMKFHNYIVWLLIIFLTLFLYVIFLIGLENNLTFNSVGTMKITFRSSIIWLNIFMVNGFCALFNYFIVSFKTILIKNIHNELVTIKQKDNLFHDYVKTFPEKIKQLLIYKGCYVEDDEKNNKPKVNKTFKKHSSLRRVKMKRQRTNCVEFVGVSDDKERDIDFIDDDNDNDKEVENNDGISIYQRRKKKFKTGKLKVNFNIQEFAKQKNNILNVNNNDNNSTHKINLFSKSEKNIKKNIKDSFLVVDQKKDIKDDNIKNKHINNTSISNSSEQKKIDGKKKVAINEKIIKHESQRGLVPKVSFQK